MRGIFAELFLVDNGVNSSSYHFYVYRIIKINEYSRCKDFLRW